MVTSDGKFFHVDFAFILGNEQHCLGEQMLDDDLRFAPAMFEALGNSELSTDYQKFLGLIWKAHAILKPHSEYLLSLLYLMADSGIACLPQNRLCRILDATKQRMEISNEALKRKLEKNRESCKATFVDVVHGLGQIRQELKASI